MTPNGLLPQPKPAEGTPSVHASLVNLSIKVKVLLRLMSPRAFSSRQGVGVFKDFVQFKLTQGSEIVNTPTPWRERSEEHTSELQSQSNLVCRLLLEKTKNSYLDCF